MHKPEFGRGFVRQLGHEDFVLLSDVHLGSDLVDRARPWSRDTWLREQAEVDERLETLIAYYGKKGRPVRFVIAGDFVDFVGMSISPPEDCHLPSGLTDEERAHGLGSAADHSAHKVWAVARRHPRVFRAFATALARGHSLVVVHGNHDVEWHWGSARKVFVRALAEHLTDEDERAELRRRVEFRPWFYYVPGLLYVEHGHEYDPMCSYGDPLLPICPSDKRRIRRSPSDVLMRYVARPTPGLSTAGHERATFVTYMRVAASFGLRGGFRLLLRFLRASARLLRNVVAYRARRESLEQASVQRMRAHGRKHRIAQEVLSTLRSLHARPAAQSIHGVLRSLYLDRIGLGVLVCLVCAVAFSCSPSLVASKIAAATALGALFVGAISGRGRDLDASHRMRAAARRIAAELGVRFVAMGHTHEPRMDALGSDRFYVNLGYWGEDELPEDRVMRSSPPPPCSYFALTTGPDAISAALYAWDPARGPRVLSVPEQVESGVDDGAPIPVFAPAIPSRTQQRHGEFASS